MWLYGHYVFSLYLHNIMLVYLLIRLWGPRGNLERYPWYLWYPFGDKACKEIFLRCLFYQNSSENQLKLLGKLIIITSLSKPPLLGHRLSKWITHKENVPLVQHTGLVRWSQSKASKLHWQPCLKIMLNTGRRRQRCCYDKPFVANLLRKAK
jgi:hypothetical protein